MSYTVAFEQRQRTLRVQVSAPRRDYADMLDAWRRIIGEVARGTPEALLVVTDIQGAPLTSPQIEAFVGAMRGSGLERLRIAYVYPLAADWSQAETAEILALESGFEARVFADERAAETWLRHGER
jgi:hypothetical protein